MEADGFWDLFREYEEAGGGYIHTVVQPDMERLAWLIWTLTQRIWPASNGKVSSFCFRRFT